MAKRALRRPALPPGARLGLFLFLQALVLRAGDPSTVELGTKIGVSHQAIWKALTGPKVPSRQIVGDLVDYLGRLIDPVDDLVDQARRMWTDAVTEERDVQAGVGPDGAQRVSAPRGTLIEERSGSARRGALSRQDFAGELNKLRTDAGLTIRDVARRTGIPVATLGGYFSGRNLPTSELRERLTRILQVCNITDPYEVNQWQEALARVRARALRE